MRTSAQIDVRARGALPALSTPVRRPDHGVSPYAPADETLATRVKDKLRAGSAIAVVNRLNVQSEPCTRRKTCGDWRARTTGLGVALHPRSLLANAGTRSHASARASYRR